jgi:GNAT superfamily N-acetyltransferase
VADLTLELAECLTKSPIRKAETKLNLAQEFVSFRKEGDKLLQMISGLHTSRVSAYGFTLEANATDVQRYAVSEQLDTKICPVCKIMHGKVFFVSDASKALDIILATDNPDDLRSLQPWPKKDKASLDALADMDDIDIIRSNWHIPPYHPYCRGILVPEDKVPTIEQTASWQAAFPLPLSTNFTDADIKAAFPETFSEAKVVDAWNKLVKRDPREVVELLTGVSFREIQQDLEEWSRKYHFGLRSGMDGNLGFWFNGRMFGLEESSDLIFLLKADSSLYLAGIGLPASAQGKGVGKQVISTLVDFAKSLGVTKITLNADIDIGAYAWARYGWLPSDLKITSEVWGSFFNTIAWRINEGLGLPADVKQVATAALARLRQGDQLALWAISDIPQWGARILRGVHWDGVLDFSNPLAMARFNAYVTP